MAIPRLNTDTDNIQQLADRPNDQNGLSAAELKALFDKAGGDIKNYINNTLIPYFESAAAANGIGIDAVTSLTANNVQDAIAELARQIADLQEEIHSPHSSVIFSVAGGVFRYGEVATESATNWEIALLSGTNAKINFAKIATDVDVFLVGGGRNGNVGSVRGTTAMGGQGGYGGGVVMKRNVHVDANTDYSFTVGRSGQMSAIFGETTYGAPYGNYYETGVMTAGGEGASGEVDDFPMSSPANPGLPGALAFGEQTSILFSGRRYSAGGGGGGVLTVSAMQNGAAGGATGGGAGGSRDIEAANGEDNTGSGGGGAFWDNDHSDTAGAGGSGIIIIRNARG